MNRDQLAMGQGLYFAATGVWPIVHLPSFEAVAGPKPEGWLVKTAGVLITCIGATVGLAGWKKRVTPEIALLAAGSALGLAAIDVWYGGIRRRISPVYLADGVAELGLAGLWAKAAKGPPRRRWR